MVRSSTLLRSLKKDRIRKKKLHGAGNRLETGPEIAKRLQLAREKAQRRATRETGEAAEAAETQAIRQGQTLGQAGQTDEQRAAEEQAAYDGTAGEFDEEEEEEEEDDNTSNVVTSTVLERKTKKIVKAREPRLPCYIQNDRTRDDRYRKGKSRLKSAFIKLGIISGCYGILYIRKYVLISLIYSLFRGGTEIAPKEKDSPIVFTPEIHSNAAYYNFASEHMAAVVNWEDNFRRNQQQK